MRPLQSLVVALCICATASSAAEEAPRSAYFCQGEGGPGRAHASAAIRGIPDGDVQFAISKWQENGHHFGLHGVAQRDGEQWVYKERTRNSIYNEDDGLFYEVDIEPDAMPTCKVTISWLRNDQLSVLVDEKIGCDGHHGRAFGWLSSLFTPEDYNGDVRDEFDRGDFSTLGLRCSKPGSRHGPVQVVR